MTLKPNTDNGIQGRTTEHQLPTAVTVAQLDNPEQADPSMDIKFKHCHSGGC
jgi:hypothetical protein